MRAGFGRRVPMADPPRNPAEDPTVDPLSEPADRTGTAADRRDGPDRRAFLRQTPDRRRDQD